MIEEYLFYLMFILQITIMSVLYPGRLVRLIRLQMARYPAAQFPRLYPDGERPIQRSLGYYRLLSTFMAVIGFILLGLLFSYMQQADWSDGPVEAAINLYFMLQWLPLGLLLWTTAHFNKRLRNTVSEEKRRAVLQRRGLFDFISPVIVFFTLLCYPVFVALVIWIQRNPFPGFAGYINIAGVTFLYAWIAFWVYRTLYGRKSNPLQTHADRMHEIGMIVKLGV